MPGKYTATMLVLLCSAIPCFAGGLKFGRGFDEWLIKVAMGYVASVHVLGIIAFIVRTEWVRVTAGVLYAPVFLLLTGLCFLNLAYALLFLFAGAFFTFIIIIRRK